MESLTEKFLEKYARTNISYIRDYVNTIDWNNRLIGLKGSRGIGKTTLILQYIKSNYKITDKVIYISLDDLYFTENSLYDFVNHFYKRGGEFIALDEVHRYPNWAIEIKNIYDDMPDLKLIFTGSSLLHLNKSKADLSRRAVMYSMPGLSFREFLWFETGINFNKLELDELLTNHISISADIISKIKPLAYFEKYLNYGYYPFYLENRDTFHQKLSEVVLTILEVDIPQFANINTSNIIYLKKLLQIISGSVPFKPNMNALSERTGISLNTMKHYIKLLNDAELLQLLYVKGKSINSINKPEKIYLGNTNLIYNNSIKNIGNIRETFFFNQLKNKHIVNAHKQTDFLVDDKYAFEIGGKNKTKKQIKGISNAYVVKDDIEIGQNNTIPLWLFGMMY